MPRVIHIPVEGPITVSTTAPTLESLQAGVGGYVQPVYGVNVTPRKARAAQIPLEGRSGFTGIALVDEDGTAKRLPVNTRASVILSGLLQFIVGDVVLLDGFDLD